MHVIEVDLFERCLVQGFGGEFFHQGPGFHDADAVGEFPGPEQVMSRHQHRRAVIGKLPQQPAKFIRGAGVQAGQRFVEQQRPGALGERDREPDLLPHALGIRADFLIRGALIQPNPIEQSAEMAFIAMPAAEPDEIVEILQARQGRIQRHLLGHVAEFASRPLQVGGHFGSVNDGGARSRFEKPEKKVYRRRLARAVGAEQTDDLLLVYRKIQAIQRRIRPE